MTPSKLSAGAAEKLRCVRTVTWCPCWVSPCATAHKNPAVGNFRLIKQICMPTQRYLVLFGGPARRISDAASCKRYQVPFSVVRFFAFFESRRVRSAHEVRGVLPLHFGHQRLLLRLLRRWTCCGRAPIAWRAKDRDFAFSGSRREFAARGIKRSCHVAQSRFSKTATRASSSKSRSASRSKNRSSRFDIGMTALRSSFAAERLRESFDCFRQMRNIGQIAGNKIEFLCPGRHPMVGNRLVRQTSAGRRGLAT